MKWIKRNNLHFFLQFCAPCSSHFLYNFGSLTKTKQNADHNSDFIIISFPFYIRLFAEYICTGYKLILHCWYHITWLQFKNTLSLHSLHWHISLATNIFKYLFTNNDNDCRCPIKLFIRQKPCVEVEWCFSPEVLTNLLFVSRSPLWNMNIPTSENIEQWIKWEPSREMLIKLW